MKPLTCYHGTTWTWPHVCAACEADVERACAAFDAAVAAGIYDRWGYRVGSKEKRTEKQLWLLL